MHFSHLSLRDHAGWRPSRGHKEVPQWARFAYLNRLKADNLLEPLRKTPLYDFNVQHGAKMFPFAGYHMPLVYGDASQGPYPSLSRLEVSDASIVASHQHVRQSAGLFDVGHMVQSKYVPQKYAVVHPHPL